MQFYVIFAIVELNLGSTEKRFLPKPYVHNATPHNQFSFHADDIIFKINQWIGFISVLKALLENLRNVFERVNSRRCFVSDMLSKYIDLKPIGYRLQPTRFWFSDNFQSLEK